MSTAISQEPHRLAFLDAARAFALLLGIAFHAGLSFIPIFINWAVMDVSTSHVVSAFSLVSHSFRMPLFFLIAGFFCHASLAKHGYKAFTQSKLIRLGIPFLIGWFLMRPLLIVGWIMGSQSMRGQVDIQQGFSQSIDFMLASPGDLFIGTHLWFLYYLLFFLLIAALFKAFFSHFVYQSPWVQKISRAIAVYCATPFVGVVLLSLATSICMSFMQSWSIDTPDKSLVPNVPVSFLYGGCFLFGYLTHKHNSALQGLTKINWLSFLMVTVSVTLCIYLAQFERHYSHSNYELIRIIFLFSYAVMMWSLIRLCLGLCKLLLNRTSRTVNYVSDASYWLYLSHLPVVIALQIIVAEWSIHWSVKWAGVFCVSLLILTLIYDLLVRNTWLGKLLNGSKKPRVLFT